MNRNRMIMLLLLIGALVLTSLYGGLSYIFLYAVIGLPFVSFLHLLYFMRRLDVKQSVGSNVLQKEEQTPYLFSMQSSRHAIYPHLKVCFLSGPFTMEGMEPFGQLLTLFPDEKVAEEGVLSCRYRGNYFVGARNIEVTDFLGLFKLKKAVAPYLPVQVVPRIIRLSRLNILPLEEDIKFPSFSSIRKEIPDVETRNYISGDSLKMVNWKLSARQQELMIRKHIDMPKARITLIMDLIRVPEDELSRAIIEDKIIETALAITNYFNRQHIPVEIFYGQRQAGSILVWDQSSFDRFFRVCCDVPFISSVSAASILEQLSFGAEEKDYCVVVTHSLDSALSVSTSDIIMTGSSCTIVYIGEEPPASVTRNFAKEIDLIHISKSQEIADVLDVNQGVRS